MNPRNRYFSRLLLTGVVAAGLTGCGFRPSAADVVAAAPAAAVEELPAVKPAPQVAQATQQPEAPARVEAKPKPPELVVVLPDGKLQLLPSPETQRPVPVPDLSHGQPDRAPLTDPTRDASMAAALAAPVAPRATPAPFERLNLPEPFEHRGTVSLNAPPPEAVPLSLLPPRTPPKTLPEKGPVSSASR